MPKEPDNFGINAAQVFHDLWRKGIITSERIEAAVETNENLTEGSVEELISSFEDASHFEDGAEIWNARDIMRLLGYASAPDFLGVIQKAKDACRTTGQLVENHFTVASGATSSPDEISSIRLTRYACYLIAQNGDPRKAPIAFAQTYFAIQTRRQEIQDEDEQIVPLSEDYKRLMLRDEMKQHNKKLASVAKNAGVVSGLDFAIFTNSGYQGLYGGLDRVGIQRKKGLASKQNILDYMGSTELAANLFRATQTEEKLQREKTKGKESANRAHYEVGRKVRQTIQDIGGVMPENLPVAEDLVKIGRRLKKAIERSGDTSDENTTIEPRKKIGRS